MMWWQWHQLDHMQVICTLLQTDNHTSTSSLIKFFSGLDGCPTNGVKALKAVQLIQNLVCCDYLSRNRITGTPNTVTSTRITALDRGRTDRISLTHDLDLQSSASYDHDLLACKISRSTVSQFRRQSGNKRTDRGECITSHANAVGNYIMHILCNVWSVY